MTNRAETYRQAAREHAAALPGLHDRGLYVLSHYVAGVAVECILRAYRCRIDPAFDSRHDLETLAQSSGFLDRLPTEKLFAVKSSIGEVVLRWSNAHRYRSAAELRARLRGIIADRRVKGDRLRYSSQRIVNAAIIVVAAGDARWNASGRS